MELEAHDPEHEFRHLVVKIEYAKRGAANITCTCGFTAMVGTWYDKPPPGWDAGQWPKIYEAINALDTSFPWETGGPGARKL